METLYALLTFFIILGIVCVLGFLTYRYCNNKIIGSNTIWQLAGYAQLMLTINSVLLIGGILVMFKVYSFLVAAAE